MSDTIQEPIKTPIKLTRLEIKHELWIRGDLTWKMHKVQKEMWKIYSESEPHSMMVWLLSRQTGKSYFLVLVACMEAIKNPNCIVKILTDTKVHAKNIFEPLFREILVDCPDSVKPTFNQNAYTFTFPNGSQVQIAGSDSGHAEKLRGQKSQLVLIDEAGFCDKLNYNVLSILLPTTTHTGGKIVMASTPPQDPNHDFIKFIEKAEMEGRLVKKTIFENPLLGEEQRQHIINQFPLGIKDPQFRREYLCELIRDEENCLFPEMTEEALKDITKEWQRPPFFDYYVGMDLGFNDLTVVLYGYYDFINDKIVIDHEIAKKGKDIILPVFTQELLETEKKLYSHPLTHEEQKPTDRVSDVNPWVLKEILTNSFQKLWFNMAKKHDKQAAINSLRSMLMQGKIIINPECKTLLQHVKHVKWANTKTKETFADSPDEGHYDAVDALLYLVRSMSFTKNPYPPGYNMNMKSLHVQNPNNYQSAASGTPAAVFKMIFGRKR